MPLNSPFYIRRECDREMQEAISAGESIVLVKGGRQMGKTSLLARGLKLAREEGRAVVTTDLQRINETLLTSLDTFYRTLAEMFARELKLKIRPVEIWNAADAPNVNLEEYLCAAVLDPATRPVVWALDEVDSLFDRSYSSEFFSLVGTWHNARALNPATPWRNLTVIISFATEPKLFIRNLNVSPFNVGRTFALADFTRAQIAELNDRYDRPLCAEADVDEFSGLVGGQPYLVRRGLYEMAVHGLPYAKLREGADRGEGIYGDHLRRLYTVLKKDDELLGAVRCFLGGENQLTEEQFYRLRSGGLLTGDSRDAARLRCGLYASFLKRHI